MKAVIKTVEAAEREARFDHIRPHYIWRRSPWWSVCTVGFSTSSRMNSIVAAAPTSARCRRCCRLIRIRRRIDRHGSCARAAIISARTFPTISKSWSRWASSIISARASTGARCASSSPKRAARSATPLMRSIKSTCARWNEVGGINADQFGVLNKALHRLERFWTDQILLSALAKTKINPPAALLPYWRALNPGVSRGLFLPALTWRSVNYSGMAYLESRPAFGH